MKKSVLLFIFAFPLFLYESVAQTQDEKSAAFREAVVRGEQIFGGIMLAQKCNIFEKKEYGDFEVKAKAIIGAVKKGVGQEKVNVMVKQAQLGIRIETYSNCGEKAKQFVKASKQFVDKTYSILSVKEN